MDKKMIIVSIVVIIVSVVSFFGGVQYAKHKATATFGQLRNGASGMLQRGARGGTGGMMNSQFTMGEIIAKDDTSITLKLRDGGSKIIFYSNTTTVAKNVVGTSTDLSIGKQATVNGIANQDGSVTATSIELRDTTMVK